MEFRGLKQTLNRADLRCRNDQRLLVELDWSILGMAVAELFALKEQLDRRAAKRKRRDPSRRSLAEAMRALRWCLRNLKEPAPRAGALADRLRAAVIDDYRRRSSKRARYRPKNPDKKPLGNPKLRCLTRVEIRELSTREIHLPA